MLLTAQHINKKYGEQLVLKSVSFALDKGQVMSVLGASGSGKTTLLKILAGLEVPDAGQVSLHGQDITHTPPQQRGIVYLYQEPLLFPHLSVAENVGFGLRLRKNRENEVREQVSHMLERLELYEHLDKMPRELSGGQKQRVAFGRALIINPQVLLLDEPFAALDSPIRSRMQSLFKEVAAEYGITALFVTHDLKEALIMGDNLAVIRDGKWIPYPDRQSFLNDPDTGVHREIAFWNQWTTRKT